jgi:glycosyltransferase involved in cell wall biosynthesis
MGAQEKSAETLCVQPSESKVDRQYFRGKRAIVVMHSVYPGDARPRRAAEALTYAGMKVEVVCLRETDEEPERELFNSVDITRLDLRHRRGGKLYYLVRYCWVIVLLGAILALRSFKRRYDVVHVHNMPDILILSALVPKLLGAKVILDLHDPMPELMQAIFGLQENSLSVWLLKEVEKRCVGFADLVITPNDAFRRIFLSRTGRDAKINVIMNSPDEVLFRDCAAADRNPTVRDRSTPFVVMYHGALVERHGLDLAVTAMGKVLETVPNAQLRVYGRRTAFLDKVMGSVDKLNLSNAIQYCGARSLEQIAEAIGECDLGIIPNRRSAFTQVNMPIRIFEFLSQAKPVIAPKTPGILDYFGSEDLLFFELGDAADLAAKIEYAFSHPQEVTEIVERGQRVYRRHRWSSERVRFLSLTDQLLDRRHVLSSEPR